jgi:hypothetical protein
VQLIYSDQELVSNFIDNNSLLDGKIEKIEIFQANSSVSINIYFAMRPSSDFKKIILQFSGCKQYGFSYSDDYFFYNVELVKFFQTEEGLFYVSFDPYDELEKVSDKDQDFVLSSNVSAYKILFSLPSERGMGKLMD